jgi:hypothetical protein
MKKNTIIKVATTSVLVFGLSMFTVTTKKDFSLKSKLSQLSIITNNALATPVATYHTDIYNSAKREVNMEVKGVVDAVNTLLTAASITSCSSIPAVSVTKFYTNGTHDLYSSTVPVRPVPLTVSGKSFSYTHLLELKLSSTNATVGRLYIDCTNGAIEVRYMGKNDGGDTNLAIAYYEDSSARQTILMVTDYLAGTGYNAAKMAVYYTEGVSSQTVTYGYAEAATGATGTLTADTGGNVTAATDGDVTTGTAVTDLQNLTGLSTVFTIADIRNNMIISL